jgi:hypothetical protein
MSEPNELDTKNEYIAGMLSFRLKPKTAWWLVTAVAGLIGYAGFVR